ncbi:TetR/AcrR family transcriptional regulator [Gordonia sp. CPCC 206044]|uniref:TetR/AcrR family transcriptional regulator n=1 Tax=Gordonia sp. CPCC 206044 TaxID=3140793 RepID=UPI003AF3D46F
MSDGDISDGASTGPLRVDVASASAGDLDATARKIVTAARITFVERGFADTTMQDIADAAGVGVATVYRRFGHRKTLVRHAIMDESMRMATLMSEIAEQVDGPEELLVETFGAFVHEASAPKLLTRNLRRSDEVAELSAFLSDTAIVGLGRGLVSSGLRVWQDRGRLPTHLDTDVVAEILVRMVLSLIESPDDSTIPIGDPERAREFAETYLVPLLQTR